MLCVIADVFIELLFYQFCHRVHAQETAKAGLALHMAFEKCATAHHFL